MVVTVDLGQIFAEYLKPAQAMLEEITGVALGDIKTARLDEFQFRENFSLSDPLRTMAAAGINTIYYNEPFIQGLNNTTHEQGIATLFHELSHIVMIRCCNAHDISEYDYRIRRKGLQGLPPSIPEGYPEYISIQMMKELRIPYRSNVYTREVSGIKKIIAEKRFRSTRQLTLYVEEALQWR